MSITIYTDRFEFLGGAHYPVQTHVALDITVKKGESPYAPTWEMVMGYKQGKLSWGDYVRKYEGLLKMREDALNEQAERLLATGRDIVLLCFCEDKFHCHRTLAAADLMARFSRMGMCVAGAEEKPSDLDNVVDVVVR